ncbi:zinc finger protein-like [Culicoides brevitarsis]|uniref:zinc finger protein-like n=1 Tax=Culicoides brevitarsis TaxID=469753 RepID=UPI00307C43B8
MESSCETIICRCCLSKDEKNVFFDIRKSSYGEKSFKEIIESLICGVVEEQEPSFVCESCANLLGDSYKFIKMLKESQLIINGMKNEDFLVENSHLKCMEDVIEEVFEEEIDENHQILSLERLESHLNVSHEDQKVTEKLFQCDLCRISLKSKECLSNHMKAKHLNRRFPCKFCENSYKSRSGLHQHEQQHHTKAIIYECLRCPYKSHSKTLLRKHENRHFLKEKKFECEICGRNFVSSDNLKRHQFVHIDKRPINCETCEKSFKTTEALKKHEACHKEYRYECPICSRKYLTNQAMRAHCTKLHPKYDLPPAGTVLASDAKSKHTKNLKLERNLTKK